MITWLEFFKEFGDELERAYAKGGSLQEIVEAACRKGDANIVPSSLDDEEFTEFVNAVKLWE